MNHSATTKHMLECSDDSFTFRIFKVFCYHQKLIDGLLVLDHLMESRGLDRLWSQQSLPIL